MKKRNISTWLVVLSLICASWLAGCQGLCQEETFGGPLTGVDHLADYLNVAAFWVNGSGGFPAGGGSGGAGEVTLPRKWHPGLTVDVKWEVSNWKEENGTNHEAIVPVDPYTEPARVWVHFLANGSVRVVVSDYLPWNSDYPGPHDPIPDKNPWDEYPQSWVNSTDR